MDSMPKVLIACEESQAVTIEMRKLGIEAFSCDILPCSGGHPEWHIMGDVSEILNHGWDMIIAFPPCNHLAVSGARWYEQKRKDGRQQAAIDFFMQIINANCDKIAVENPVGLMSSVYRKPDQIIHPYYFGDPYSKKTCLWLKGLPKLEPTNIVDKGNQIEMESGKKMSEWYRKSYNASKKKRASIRSKTFHGIAAAMAEQWGKLL